MKVKKTFIELKPTTEIYLTELGRIALIDYVPHFSNLLEQLLSEETKDI